VNQNCSRHWGTFFVTYTHIYRHNGCFSLSLQERVCVSEQEVAWEICVEIQERNLGIVSGRCFDPVRLPYLCKVE
jgi:hypothetical protein